MGSISVISAYAKSIMLVLMPLAGMMLIFYSGFQLWKDLRGADRKKIRERLREDESRQRAKKLEQSIARQSKQEKPFFERAIQQVTLTKKIDKWISQANWNIEATQFLTFIAVAVSVIFIGGILLKFSIWIVIATAVASAYLPIVALQFMAKRRMSILVAQLPGVFELISQALRAGHAFPSGVQLVGQQLPDPAGTEFALVFHEQNLGIKMEEALSHFADRTDQLDIRFFVTAVLIQRQTGGDLSEVLDKIGSVIRERIEIKGQVKALTAEGRMSGWVLSILPFFVFALAWVMNPDYAGVLLYTQEGHFMLGAAGFFQVIGMLMIKKIVDIKI